MRAEAAETARTAERDRDRLARDLARVREELTGRRRERDGAAQAARAAAERDIARGRAETAETARREVRASATPHSLTPARRQSHGDISPWMRIRAGLPVTPVCDTAYDTKIRFYSFSTSRARLSS